MLFTELPLCDTLLDGLLAMNFKETTPVQEQAIPVILEKKDVIACAQTGTGKTAAFLLPLLNNLQTDAHEEGKINAIVMAPTRELAQQIDQQMEGFSYYTPFSSVAVYGGNDGDAWDVQKRGLLSGADVVIATPGRLLSHINLYNIDFSGVKYFILDEADRMLDMGFHDDIMKIEKLLPKDRQTIMFSATMPPKIQHLAKTILRNPVDIAIAIARPPETILQSAYICHEAQKINIVKSLFKEKAPNKVILFSGSKQKVKEIAKILSHMGLSAGEMHSDLDQSQRNHVMHEFKNERVNILVATDIVARGIDIDDISLVINFDVPYDAEDYVHRIGRTARAGDSGMAITFVSPDEQYRFSRIEQFLGKQIYRIPVPSELGDAPEFNPVRDNRRGGVSFRTSKGGGKKGKDTEKKGGKTSGRTEKPSNAGDLGITEKSDKPYRHEKKKDVATKEGSEKQENSNELQNPDRLEMVENTGIPRNSKKNKEQRQENILDGDVTLRPEKGTRKKEKSQHEENPRHYKVSRLEENQQEGQASRDQEVHKKQEKRKREGDREQGSSRKQETSEKERVSKQKGSTGRHGSTGEKGTSGGHKHSDRKGQSKGQKNEGHESSVNKRGSGDQKTSQTPHTQRTQRNSNPKNEGSFRKKESTPQKPATSQEENKNTDKPKKWWSWLPFGKK